MHWLHDSTVLDGGLRSLIAFSSYWYKLAFRDVISNSVTYGISVFPENVK